MMKLVTSIVSLLMILLSTFQADASVPLGAARKGNDGKFDMYGCMQSNDYYVVNFAAYQIDPAKIKETKSMPPAECIDMPALGPTQITLDLLDRDVRRKEVVMKIFGSDKRLLSETQKAVAKQGIISTNVDFKNPGKYEVVLYVNDTDLNIPSEISALHIPVSAGLETTKPLETGTLQSLFTAIGIIIIGLGFLLPRLLKPQAI